MSQPATAAVTATTSHAQLYEFLKTCPSLKPETAAFLFEQEVDGAAFLGFTEASLALNFNNLIYGQRIALLRIISQVNSTSPATPTNIPADDGLISLEPNDDLGCRVLQDSSSHLNRSSPEVLTCFVDPFTGLLENVVNIEQQKNSSCLSASFLKKRETSIPVSSSPQRSKKSKPVSDDIEPMAVRSELTKTERGKKVIEFIENNGFVDVSNQIAMMSLLYESFINGKQSPEKYYPPTSSKISIAKGIVADFPQLADKVRDCPWSSWLNIVITKFETVQSKLPAAKKRNKINANKASSTSSSKAKQKPRKADADAATEKNDEGDSVEDIEAQKAMLRDMMPTKTNRGIISVAMSATYTERRRWIRSTNPTCTDILHEYHHLTSYQGAMVLEEFSRMEPLHEDFVAKFKKLSPYILNYAKVTKPNAYQEITVKFGMGPVSALVLLPKLINNVINKNTVSQGHLDHIKKYKAILEAIPSLALVQISPEGTDAESVDSKESSRDPDDFSPVFPYLLWLTNDFENGQIFLKIDRTSLLVAECCSETKDGLVRALDMLVKAHFVFNLEYHPYLKSVYEYVEYLLGIRTAPVNSVVKFASAIRQLSQSS